MGYLLPKLIELLKNKLLILLFLTLFLGAIASYQPISAFYGILKFIELGYLAFYVKETFRKKDIPLLLYSLSMGGVVTTIILLFQLFHQGSLGGVFYLLGERTFNATTTGMAVFTFGDLLILRPNGTFPHPNVASFYLLFVFAILFYSPKIKLKFLGLFVKLSMAVVLFGILITFSRVTIFALLVILTIKLFNTRLFSGKYLLIGFFILAVAFARLQSGLVRDLGFRLDLLPIAFNIFLKNPLLGVGLQNFFYHEIDFQHQISPTLLQPVHNIYLYLLSTTGIFGISIVLIFISRFIKYSIRLLKSNSWLGKASSALVLFILFGGLFDHYFLTLQQGQLVVAIILGLIYSSKARDLV